MNAELKWIEHVLDPNYCCWYCFILYNFGGTTIEDAMKKVLE